MRSLALVVLLVSTCAAQAEIHKCTDKTGRKYYQDLPCDKGHETATFDPDAGNVTTIDSETVHRETRGALITREETRERRVEVVAPAGADTHVTISQPDEYPDSGYDRYDGYPVYNGNDRRRRGGGHAGGGHGQHGRPDETPMQEPRRAGGNYVPAPPTIRQVAPRAPAASPSAASRERNSRPVRGRDDDRSAN